MNEEKLIDIELIKLKERQTNQLNCDLFEKCCDLQQENEQLKTKWANKAIECQNAKVENTELKAKLSSIEEHITESLEFYLKDEDLDTPELRIMQVSTARNIKR